MGLRQRVANWLISSHKNSFEDNLARDFFRYGSRQPMYQNWSQVVMSDQDKYTGYMYGAITRRAAKVAKLAKYNLMTRANERTVKEAKAKNRPVVHPYVSLIKDSTFFTTWGFWYAIETYRDLFGIAYVHAVRAKTPNGRVLSDAKYFQLLNPYNVMRIWSTERPDEVQGYVETKDGFYREIEPHQVIEIPAFNPFSARDTFSMADAAKDAQFTLKQANQQLRSTLNRNEKLPGVVLIGDKDVELNPEQLQNFKARMMGRNRTKEGEPIFASGKGTVDWNDMQVDLKKSMPDVVNELSVNTLIAASGVSRTKFGIEQSGVTRDTADVQDDQFTADQVMTELEFILGALDLDFKKHYPTKQADAGYEMYIDSPLGVDREAEKLDIEIRREQKNLVRELVDGGYEYELAVKYATGQIDLDGLGEPTNPPKQQTDDTEEDDPEEDDGPKAKAAQNAAPYCTCPSKGHAHQELEGRAKAEVEAQTSNLQAVAVNVESRIAAAVIDKVTNNAFESEDDIIDAKARQEAEQELELALRSFYTVLLNLWAQEAMKQTMERFGLGGTFRMDKAVRDYITETAQKTAASHVATVVGDLHQTIQITARRLIDEEVKRLKGLPEIPGIPDKGDKAIYELARRTALAGAGQEEIVRAVRQEFQQMSKTRAVTIARDQAMRAYNRAQYEADREFVAQNGLEAQAYKRWVTRSGNPCPFCRAQAARGLIPFSQPFVELGTVLTETYEKKDGTTGVRKLSVDYEEAVAGNLHTNCQCKEELVIRRAK